MTGFDLRARTRYYFDNYMSRGTMALIGGLFALTLLVIFLAALIVVGAGITPVEQTGEPLDFLEAIWAALMRTIDTGTIAGDNGWQFRLIMFAVTVCGILIFSALIGVLSRGLECKLESLRKGRSRVIEANHTVILGWSPQIFTIISELIIANESQKNPCVVIMSENDKVVMEDNIHFNVPNTKNTRIVCRTGNPIDINDLEILSLQTCKSIIICSPPCDEPDVEVIKTLLAIVNSPSRRAERYHIVAEIVNPENYDIAALIGKDEAELVKTDEITARIITQSCRQTSLSVVYNELFSFRDNEIYLKSELALYGKPFHEIQFAYNKSSVIGIIDAGNIPIFNPPEERIYQEGEKLIFIAEDDASIHLSKSQIEKTSAPSVVASSIQPVGPEKTLIIGWNNRANYIINELQTYVAQGSVISVAVDDPTSVEEIRAMWEEVNQIKLETVTGALTKRSFLESLDPCRYDHIIVLAKERYHTPQESDARTIMILLYLRDIANKANHRLSIVSEMIDSKNCQLAEIARVDDFIVSERLISLIITQISENKSLNVIFRELLDSKGCEIYLENVENYVELGKPVNFYTVIAAGIKNKRIPFGYKLNRYAGDASRKYGIVINPDKSQLITFQPEDRIIVIAE